MAPIELRQGRLGPLALGNFRVQVGIGLLQRAVRSRTRVSSAASVCCSAASACCFSSSRRCWCRTRPPPWAVR